MTVEFDPPILEKIIKRPLKAGEGRRIGVGMIYSTSGIALGMLDGYLDDVYQQAVRLDQQNPNCRIVISGVMLLDQPPSQVSATHESESAERFDEPINLDERRRLRDLRNPNS